VSAMAEAFINNARRLKGVPQGIINVHLSKIRNMWDKMYNIDNELAQGKKKGEKLEVDSETGSNYTEFGTIECEKHTL
jgi:hypothetical protein